MTCCDGVWFRRDGDVSWSRREWLATEMGVSLQQAENELLQRKVGC